MKTINILYFILVLIITFLFTSSLIYKTTNDFSLRQCLKEGFGEPSTARCPNMLIEKDSKIYLYNSQLANVPGVNPIQFDNLAEYTEFLNWQKSVNIHCPVLYLQYTNDAQGQNVYKLRNDIDDTKYGAPPIRSVDLKKSQNNSMNDGGVDDVGDVGDGVDGFDEVDAGKTITNNTMFDNGIYDWKANTNNYPGYDPQGQDIGVITPLDKMNDYNQYKLSSDNAMMHNWDHATAVKNINNGVYQDNEVYKGNDIGLP